MSIAQTGLQLTALAALFAAVLPVAQAQSSPQQGLAQTRESAVEGVVAGNRAGVIQQIVDKWKGSLGSTEGVEQFAVTLDAASNRQLANILAATSFERVRGELLGRAAGAMGDSAPMNLGDLTNDLTFTPNNPPCRVFDTRNYGGGVPPGAATTRNYQVYGAAATMVAQGGNPAGCSAPKGEPVAVSINITAVPVGVPGHIRVFPFGGALPTVSFVNFNGVVGNNIANSGIISTCYLCASDLTVYNAAAVHHVGDVMGFFYPVAINYADSTEVINPAIVAGSNYAMNATTVTPSHNGKCLVTTHAQIVHDLGDTDISFLRTARQIGVDAPVDDGVFGFYLIPIAGQARTSVTSASFVWDVAAGTTYRFGCYLGAGNDMVGDSLYCRTTYMCF